MEGGQLGQTGQPALQNVETESGRFTGRVVILHLNMEEIIVLIKTLSLNTAN